MRCADLERSCVNVNDVRPFKSVAPITAKTMGMRSCTWRLVMTLSNRYLLDKGSTKPDRVLMVVRTSPRSRMPRRGWISAQISGRDCQLIFFFAFLGAASAVVGRVVAVVAMWVFVSLEEYLFDALGRF